MTPYQRFWLRISRKPWIGKYIAAPLDRRFSRGSFVPSSTLGTSAPTCFLTTTGRHSGNPSTTPLGYVPTDHGGVVVTGTNFGQDPHPAWTYNLDDDPRAILAIDGTETSVVARRTTDTEFEHYWPAFVATWPNYDVYRRRLQREIRMYVLEPATPDD